MKQVYIVEYFDGDSWYVYPDVYVDLVRAHNCRLMLDAQGFTSVVLMRRVVE